MHSGQYAFRDRKQKKRDFRKLWITRINAACRENEISYSRFIEGLNKACVEVNRKMLSEIAINDPKAFSELVKVAKQAKKDNKTVTKNEVKTEVTIKAGNKKAEAKTTKKEEKVEKKTAAKKETKKEEKVDYSKMTVAELKEVAKSKKIDTTGMKKADIVAALNK